MEEEKIKEAFRKAKLDIFDLQSQIFNLKRELLEIKRTRNNQENVSTQQHQTPTNRQKTSTDSTDNLPLEGLRSLNSHISIGNKGASTDRQTIRQTDRPSEKFAQLVDSLTSFKEDLKEKFQNLTNQEFLVFSTLYQLKEENKKVDYLLLSKKLNLSESSIRDYIQRMMKKGIPIFKTKEKNKKVFLSISQDFKKIASLDGVLALREPKE